MHFWKTSELMPSLCLPLHAEQAIKRSGGEARLCAVPAVMDMEEARSLVRVASQSDRTYMMAETSL